MFQFRLPCHRKKKSLQGKKVLINAGPTREYLDPVRFISNPSSGKMGFALAEVAAQLGAEVTLVAGPVSLETPSKVRRIDVVTGKQMLEACEKYFPSSNVFIATAAIGDYAPGKTSAQKIKKSGKGIDLKLRPTLDVLKTLAARKRNGQVVVGFAAETENVVKNAEKKLKEKKLDLVVANDVSKQGQGFASDRNAVTLVRPAKKNLPLKIEAKSEIAKRIWEEIQGILR